MTLILQILGFSRLSDQYIVHQIYLEFLDMIELLLSKGKLPICLLFNRKRFFLYISTNFFLERKSMQSKTVTPFAPLNVKADRNKRTSHWL